MATNFPASLDTLTNPTSSDSLSSPSHSAQHANVNDAVEALQAKVGVDSSAVTSSHDYLIADHASRLTTLEAISHGKILQVVSTIKTDTFVSSSITSGSQTPITGLSASLTCASATNKVLIQVVLGIMASTAQAASAGLIIQAGGSNILVGDAAGSRTQVNAAHLIYPGFGGGGVHAQLVWTGLYSPASTSAITYSVDIENNDGSSQVMYVNRSEGDSNATYGSRASSTITLMEVSA